MINGMSLTAEKRLDRMVEEKKVPHLLLFSGPKSAKKEEAAKKFALRLLECSEKSHPDLHELNPEGKTGMHSIGSIKNMLAQSALYPVKGPYQLFLIYEAERLLPSTANALLKTLEEPLSPSVVILITHRPEWILPTIASRAQKIFFPGPREWESSSFHQKVVEWLSKGVTLEEIETFAKADEKRKKEKEKKRLGTLPADISPHDKETLTKEIEGSLALAAKEEFYSILENVSLWYRDLYILRNEIQSPLVHTDSALEMEKRKGAALPLLQVEEALRFCQLAFERSLSLQTCLETLFMRLGRMKDSV